MAEVPMSGSQQPELDQPQMELDPELPIGLDDKVEILKGYEADLSAASYCFHHEDHTLGNAMRYMLMKNPDVEFCGYSAPHPSEPKIHLRIQMFDHKSSLVALREALTQLEGLFETIGESYNEDLQRGEYERAEVIGPSEEELRDMVRRGEEIKADKKRKEAKNKAVKVD
ncbi:hypothetical protein CBS101457_002147 [Exobasidium rhododendri]|nr:hypothetical protein CBS101457_002147 [Exobasidium rhododendri]